MVFRALLRILPADLRRDHGDAMVADLDEAMAEAERQSSGRVVAVWVASVGDLVRRSTYEHWLRGDRTRRRERHLTGLPRDLRFAVRGFRRQPATAVLLVVTLTLGMASTMAVFGLINGLVLRPLPFPNPGRLVYLNETAPRWNLEYTGINYPDYHQWREATRSFEAVGLYSPFSVNLADPAGAQRVDAAEVTHDFAAVLGIAPILGRTFLPEEGRPGGPNVVLLVEGLWRTRFGATADVIGQILRINGVPHTIVGVLPRTAAFPRVNQLWIPLQVEPIQDFESYSFEGIGRLRAGVSLAAAREDLAQAHRPIWNARDTAHVVSPVLLPLRDFLSADYRTMTMALAIGAALVLLCACANVASTMLARAIFRQREIAVRVALGADPAHVARQLIVECVVLAAGAGLASVAVGHWALGIFAAATTDLLPAWVRLEPSWGTAVAAIGLVAAAAILFGLAPAITAWRQDPKVALGDSGNRSTVATRERRLLSGFVVAEVVFATVLLSAGGLLYRAHQRVSAVDPGLRPSNVLTFQVALPRVRYPDSGSVAAFHQRLIDGLAALPGVEEAGLASCLPLHGCHQGNFFQAEGAVPRVAGSANPVTLTLAFSPGAIGALGLRIVHGRAFVPADGDAGLGSVMVSEDFARLHWPDRDDPVGRRVRRNGSDSTGWRTVVGVVGNVRHYGLDQPTRPTLYFPVGLATTAFFNGFAAVVRTAASPSAYVEPIRQLVRSLDVELPVFGVRTMDEAVRRSLELRRALAAVQAFFAAVALVLAVGGIYGVLSYIVGRRRAELGLRIALGARPGQVIRLVVRQGIRLIAIGLVVGIPLALLAGRFLGSRLVGVKPSDPWVIGIVAITIVGVGVVAAAIPGRRAALVDPRATLIAE